MWNNLKLFISTTVDKSCWDKSWKSSKFKKRLKFSNYKSSPLNHNINVESGQVWLLKAYNFASIIHFMGEGFFHWKRGFLFCLNSFVQDCRLLIFLWKNHPKLLNGIEMHVTRCWLTFEFDDFNLVKASTKKIGK